MNHSILIEMDFSDLYQLIPFMLSLSCPGTVSRSSKDFQRLLKTIITCW